MKESFAKSVANNPFATAALVGVNPLKDNAVTL